MAAMKKFRYIFEGWVDAECPLDESTLGVNPPIVTDSYAARQKTWETVGCNTVSVEEIVPPDPYLAELDQKIRGAMSENGLSSEGKGAITGLKLARALYVNQKERGSA